MYALIPFYLATRAGEQEKGVGKEETKSIVIESRGLCK